MPARCTSGFRGSPKGISTVYAVVAMTAFCAFCSLAVDFGRVQLAKLQLGRAADACARAAAGVLPVEGTNRARTAANTYASSNPVDGTPLVLQSGDLQFGTWNNSTRVFTPLTGPAAENANAVRVVARRSQARGTAIPLLFAKVIGANFCDLSAESIAFVTPAINVDQSILGTANPFLAGMPPGTVASLNNPHNSPDYAGTPSNPRQSPFAVNMPLVPGQALTFDSISGTVRHDPNLPYYEPDGQLNSIGGNTNGSEHGISDLIAPINALVGVFLDDNQPNLTPAPPRLDFRTAASRDFNELRPQLKQLFFIGDGRNSSGAHQEFIVPPGATRLYLATWDFYEWNNNAGSRVVRVNRPQKILTVK